MNKAVPIEKLRGAVFGEPLNPQYKEAETVVGECSKTEKLGIDALHSVLTLCVSSALHPIMNNFRILTERNTLIMIINSPQTPFKEIHDLMISYILN